MKNSMTPKVVEGVSEAKRYKAAALGDIQLCAHWGGPDVVLASTYDALRQQLAELQREREKSKGWIKHLKEQAQRDYHARKAAEQQLDELKRIEGVLRDDCRKAEEASEGWRRQFAAAEQQGAK